MSHLMPDEQLKCNICGVVVSASRAEQHASSSSHVDGKVKLEHELDALKDGGYKSESSVILQWEKSI